MTAMINRSRTNALMSACDLHGLIVASPPNVAYFSDYSTWLDGRLRDCMVRPDAGGELVSSFAVVGHDGISLVVDHQYVPNATGLDVHDVVTYGQNGDAPTPVLALGRALGRRGLQDADLGFEGDALAPKRRREMFDELGCARLRDCSQLLRLVRAVKSDEELDRLRTAAAINEHALTAAIDAVGPNVDVREIARHFSCQLAYAGADPDHFAYGVNGRGVATTTTRAIDPGDVFYVDFGCKHQSVYADSGTTLAAEELAGELKETFQGLRTAIDAGRMALTPGARCSEVYAAMRPQGRAAGAYVHGHSLGVELRDLPLLVEAMEGTIRDECVTESADLRIEANMVINLEAPLFLPGTASLHIEQTFVVTDRGAESIVTQPREVAIVLARGELAEVSPPEPVHAGRTGPEAEDEVRMCPGRAGIAAVRRGWSHDAGGRVAGSGSGGLCRRRRITARGPRSDGSHPSGVCRSAGWARRNRTVRA